MLEELRWSDAGIDLVGALARPAGEGPFPAVLVIHEADGIGPNVRRRAEMLAELGYVALAADLYGGGRALELDEAMTAMNALAGDTTDYRRRIRAGLDALGGVSGVDRDRLAAIGYCFGGRSALELARSGAPIRAAVSFHGILTTAEPAERGAIPARVLACNGARDPYALPDHVRAFQEEMDRADVDWQLINYGRAVHGFTNPRADDLGMEGFAYDASADRQSWAAMRLFLGEAFAG